MRTGSFDKSTLGLRTSELLPGYTHPWLKCLPPLVPPVGFGVFILDFDLGISHSLGTHRWTWWARCRQTEANSRRTRTFVEELTTSQRTGLFPSKKWHTAVVRFCTVSRSVLCNCSENCGITKIVLKFLLTQILKLFWKVRWEIVLKALPWPILVRPPSTSMSHDAIGQPRVQCRLMVRGDAFVNATLSGD